MNVLFSITLGISLLLIALLFKQLNRNKANIFLITLLTLICIGCIFSLYFNSAIPHFYLAIINAVPALFGTLIYWYVKKSLYPNSKNKLIWITFSPFIIALIIGFYLFQNPHNIFVDILLNVFIKIISSLIFMMITYKILKKYKLSLLNTFSNIEKYELNWFNILVTTAIIIYILYLLLIILLYSKIEFFTDFENSTAILLFLFTFTISYFSISNSNIFFQLSKFELIDNSISTLENQNETNQNITIQKQINPQLEEKNELHYQALLSILKDEKPYLNENLMIEDLAKKMNVHSRYLSTLINTKFNKSFFELMNHYRVLTFNEKILLPKNKNFTFLSIAFDCGFGSKSAFNRVYKKEMNMSPSEYIKSQNNK
jgi:AraC-like DNA-binding protein